MIRDYLDGDLDKINANQYSKTGEYRNVVLNSSVQKLTLEDDSVKAIIGMYEYHPRNWVGFFLIDDSLTMGNIKELKEALELLIKIKQPKRLETCSVDCPTINRWMKFMGFQSEGIREKYMFDIDYKMWSRLW